MVAIIRGTKGPTVQSLLTQERGGLTVDGNISHSRLNHQHSDSLCGEYVSQKPKEHGGSTVDAKIRHS